MSRVMREIAVVRRSVTAIHGHRCWGASEAMLCQRLAGDAPHVVFVPVSKDRFGASFRRSKAVAPVLPNALARPASRRRQRTIGRHAGMAGLALEAIGLPIALFRLGRVPFLHAASVDIMDVR